MAQGRSGHSHEPRNTLPFLSWTDQHSHTLRYDHIQFDAAAWRHVSVSLTLQVQVLVARRVLKAFAPFIPIPPQSLQQPPALVYQLPSHSFIFIVCTSSPVTLTTTLNLPSVPDGLHSEQTGNPPGI